MRRLRYRKVPFVQLWGQSQESDSSLSRFLSVHFNLLLMLPSEYVEVQWIISSFLWTCRALLSYSLRNRLLMFPSLVPTHHLMTRSLSSLHASHLHSVIHPALPHWPKIGLGSSSFHCVLVLLWHEIISRVRLTWARCSASGRVGLLTDLWMVLSSSLSLQRTGPGGGVTGAPSQVGPRGTGPPSCCLLTELFMLWEYFVGLKAFLQLWFACNLLPKF